MNFFNRALKNIQRSLTKSVLILLTFFVIGNFVIVGLSISYASDSAKTIARQNMRASVVYEKDWDKFYQEGDKIEDEEQREEFYSKRDLTTITEIQDILNDERVKTVSTGSANIAYSIGFESVLLGNEDENGNGGGIVVGRAVTTTDAILPDLARNQPNIKIEMEYLPTSIEIEDGIYTVVEGEYYTQENIDNLDKVCLITDTLAETNNLNVGDYISFSNSSPGEIGEYLSQEDYDKSVMELKIIGIFDNINEVDPNAEHFDWMSAFESPENIVLMPAPTYNSHQFEITLANYLKEKEDYFARKQAGEEIYEWEESYYEDEASTPTLESTSLISSATFLLNDPLDVESFVEEHNETAKEFYKFDAKDEEFKKLSKPLNTMELFADFIVWLVLINAIIIITLVTALTLKTREYEIGVLLSMGVSKLKVVSQFFCELAVIAILGFTLAVGTGSLLASSIGENILESQLVSEELSVEDEKYDHFVHEFGGSNKYFTQVSLEDIISKYEVKISAPIIIQLYVAGLSIVLLSILIPALMIMRFNPKKILTNTN